MSNPLRTPAVAAILDLVRETGRSAHPAAGETVSTLVYAWSVLNDRNPVEVQREVEAYADALDSSANPNQHPLLPPVCIYCGENPCAGASPQCRDHDPADYDEGAEFPRRID